MRGLAVAIDPAKPAKIDMLETVLADFFVRLIVMPDGRINLQDLLKTPGTGMTAAANDTSNATTTIAARAQEHGLDSTLSATHGFSE